MIIIPMRWAEVPSGSIVLCADGIQREVGPVDPSGASGPERVRRKLGHGSEVYAPNAMTLVVDYNDHVQGFSEAVVTFLRAGFTVEVLSS